jgi:ABC-2 type transport system ATP-binding protein
MQVRIREFVAAYNQRFSASVILTSHYMADVTALCRRIIVIDKGKIVFDGDLSRLIEQASPHKIIRVELTEPVPAERLERYGRVQAIDGLHARLNVARQETSVLAARLLTELPIADVTIEDPPIEEIIGEMFAGRAASAPVAEPALAT